MSDFKLGQTVYHETIYESREPLKVVGIRETELELEGDYSGGTQTTKSKSWLPIKGTTTIYDFNSKKESRIFALDLKEFSNGNYANQDVKKLRNLVLHLTNDVQKYIGK